MTVGELDTIPPPRPRNPVVTMREFLELVERVKKLEEAKRGRPPKAEEESMAPGSLGAFLKGEQYGRRRC